MTRISKRFDSISRGRFYFTKVSMLGEVKHRLGSWLVTLTSVLRAEQPSKCVRLHTSGAILLFIGLS